MTLAEELGLNLSLDPERKVDSRQQPDFRNFKVTHIDASHYLSNCF